MPDSNFPTTKQADDELELDEILNEFATDTNTDEDAKLASRKVDLMKWADRKQLAERLLAEIPESLSTEPLANDYQNGRFALKAKAMKAVEDVYSD